MTTYPLPQNLKDLMITIHDTIEEDRFILYGGAPVDLLLDKNSSIHDLDIALQGIDETKIETLRRKIENKGYRITEPYREYFILIKERVVLIYAENEKWFLDIGFLENPEHVGLFDAQSLYFRYPELDYVDNHNALSAIKNKCLTPIRGLDKENPYLLLARFLHLCAKYEMSLENNPNHKSMLSELKMRIKSWKSSNEFGGPIAYASCLSSILKSIIKSKDRPSFIEELVKSSVLEDVYPELNKGLEKLVSQKQGLIQNVGKIQSKYTFVKLIAKNLSNVDRENFKKCLSSLAVRHWDKEDMVIVNFSRGKPITLPVA